ncbi:MAG: hypothetical protein ABSF21_00335 [Dehalococcoidia bacterium]|jgi:hypothetical protein
MMPEDKIIPGSKLRQDAADEITERLRKLKPAGKGKDDGQGGQQGPRLLTLDDAIAEEENNQAMDIKRLAVDEIKARHEANISKAKEEAKKATTNTENTQNPMVKHWSVIEGQPVEDPDGPYSTFAQALMIAKDSIRWGIVDGRPIEDPEGPYRTFAQALQVASMERSGQQEAKRWSVLDDKPFEDPNGDYGSFAEAYKVAYLSIEKKKLEAEVKAVDSHNHNEDSDQVKILMAKLNAVEQQLQVALNPFEMLRRAKEMHDNLVESGIIPAAPTGESPASAIELEKEKNRHAEEMKKIDADDKYKTSIANTVADIPKAIGAGAADRILQHAGVKATPAAAMQTFNCTKCGTLITVGPEITKIDCPKCGAHYMDLPDSPPSVVPVTPMPEANHEGAP